MCLKYALKYLDTYIYFHKTLDRTAIVVFDPYFLISLAIFYFITLSKLKYLSCTQYSKLQFEKFILKKKRDINTKQSKF